MKKRFVALAGSTLMVAGLAVTGASPASAQGGNDWLRSDRGDRRCNIELDRSRGVLDVDINTSARNRLARVQVDFNTRRGDAVEWVRLDGRGDVDGFIGIPRGADRVRVSVWVPGARISCDETLNLRRR